MASNVWVRPNAESEWHKTGGRFRIYFDGKPVTCVLLQCANRGCYLADCDQADNPPAEERCKKCEGGK